MSIDSTIGTAPAAEVAGLVGGLGTALGTQWAPASRSWVARAPGRLDVMGGFAEYSGSLVLSYPVAGGVSVIATPRDDQSVLVCSLRHEGNGSNGKCIWPLSRFYGPGERLAEPGWFVVAMGEGLCDGAREAAAVLYALLESETIPHLSGGLTIGIRSCLPGLVGVGARAATAVATLAAVARLFDIELAPLQSAELASRGQNLLWNRAQGIADAAAVLLAERGAVLQFRCQTRESLGALPLPVGTALTGIDCGARSPTADAKHVDTRVAAFMGRRIIARILEVEPDAGPHWQGYLSQLTVADYVERLRDRLPTKITGADFLERFGETGDALTTIDPDKTYKVRSRTEHHIYENARARHFAERLARAHRTHEHAALVEAGESMYASHWSYGQRCGLGSIETDRLVNLLRAQGLAKGVFGAKVSDRGAGGTVVVFHADTQEARDALNGAAQEYARKSGLTPTIVGGTSLGAKAWGVHDGG